MQIDLQGERAMRLAIDRPARGPRRPWLQLLSEIMTLAENRAVLIRHSERAWASVTFTGTRHSVTLAFNDPAAIAAGERFIAALPDHEFTIPRQLVADAAVAEVEHTAAPDERLVVTCDLLLLEET
jgi:hypothetical protein